MEHHPTNHAVNDLFANSDPDTVWRKAVDLINRINPTFNFTIARTVFDDVMRLFHGQYPGYTRIKTPYHNLPHTLDVFLCAVRLMHGMQLANAKLTDREITLVIIATLLHDIGYAQVIDGNETGTGAQYTPTHVKRGIEFMRHYATEQRLPANYIAALAPMISCSDPRLSISRIRFPSKRARLLGQIVGTADLVGQMADRNYLEKLVALYQEFEEARMGNYTSVHDMMRKTTNFYEKIQHKLDDNFGGLYHKLSFHFSNTLGTEHNYYLESIRKNMDYLSKITAMSEPEYLSQLRRGGIVNQFQQST